MRSEYLKIQHCTTTTKTTLWPYITPFDEAISLVKEFNNNTYHEFLLRIICSVCGQFKIITTNQTYKQLTIDQMYDLKDILSNSQIQQIYNLNMTQIPIEFEKLNTLILDPSGFDTKNLKVLLFLTFLY